MTLLWGVLPDRVEDVEISPAVAVDLPAVARQLARKYELGDAGEHILLVEGYHPEPERNVPSISVVELL